MKKVAILLVILVLGMGTTILFGDRIIDRVNRPRIKKLIENGCTKFTEDGCNVCWVNTKESYGCTMAWCHSRLAKCLEYGVKEEVQDSVLLP